MIIDDLSRGWFAAWRGEVFPLADFSPQSDFTHVTLKSAQAREGFQPAPEGDHHVATVERSVLEALFRLEPRVVHDGGVYRVQANPKDPELSGGTLVRLLSPQWLDEHQARERGLTWRDGQAYRVVPKAELHDGFVVRRELFYPVTPDETMIVPAFPSEGDEGNPVPTETVLKELAGALSRHAPEGWQRIDVECRTLYTRQELALRVVTADGEQVWCPPAEVSQWFRRLRLVSYRPSTGAWFVARGSLRPGEPLQLEYEFAEQPAWRCGPGDPQHPLVEETTAELCFLRRFSTSPTVDWLTGPAQQLLAGRRVEVLASLAEQGREEHTGAQPLPGPSPARPLRFVTTFDGTDADGRPVHYRPMLTELERQAVLAYLRKAPLVMAAFSGTTDLLDPERGSVVPNAYHTDGVWVWPASMAYYLEHHRVPPPPDLVLHIRSRNYQWPKRLPQVTLRRAMGTVSGGAGVEPGVEAAYGAALDEVLAYVVYNNVSLRRIGLGMHRDQAWCLLRSGDEYVGFFADGERREHEGRFENPSDAARYLIGQLYSNHAQVVRHEDEWLDDSEISTQIWGDDPPLSDYYAKWLLHLPEGTELDRFGTPDGNTVFTAGTSLPERAMPAGWEQREYHRYRMAVSGFAYGGCALPRDGQPGGGLAIFLPRPISELLAAGTLVEVPPEPVAPPPPGPDTTPTEVVAPVATAAPVTEGVPTTAEPPAQPGPQGDGVPSVPPPPPQGGPGPVPGA
ncbi:MAG TPA: TNT domain-containing protein [Pseudonocardiaceae bacterium]